MAKLVDLLAKYLVEWPEGANDAMQNPKKPSNEYMRVYFYGACGDDFDFDLNELAEDASHACVTKSKYLAARDRLHAETVKDMKVGGVIEELDYDPYQALWDKVAVAAVNGEMSCQSNAAKRLDAGDLVGYSFAVADAFMAERAKRLKGGV